jgi:hypothetical protein
LDLEVPVFYDTILHVGTLAGVFAIYQKDIAGIMKSVFIQEKRIEGKYPPREDNALVYHTGHSSYRNNRHDLPLFL